MNAYEQKHRDLTPARVDAYMNLFGDKPVKAYPYHLFSNEADPQILIDVFVYELRTDQRVIYAAVTNGMSDRTLTDDDEPDSELSVRHELIQYFRVCTEGHARRLHDMAWLPLFDKFILECYNTVAWEHPATPGTPWKNAFFLRPPVAAHRDWELWLEGDPVTFLWHIPISDEELELKKQNDANALLDRMDAVDLPWVFDEANRPSLV